MLLLLLIHFYDYCWLQLYRVIAVSAKKILGAIHFCPNFVEVLPNHHVLMLHEYKTEFCTQIYGKDKKVLLFKSVSDFLFLVPKK